jgi:hypothetical protein
MAIKNKGRRKTSDEALQVCEGHEGSFDIGRVLTQQVLNLFRIAVDYFDGDTTQATPGGMLHDL